MTKKDAKRDSAGGSAPVGHGASPNRRRALQGIAVGLGAVGVTHWNRPVVTAVVLPAHAGTTPSGFRITVPMGQGAGSAAQGG